MKEKMTKRTIILIIVTVIVGLVSFSVAGPYFSNPDTYEDTIQTLDKKRTTVVAMTGSAAAVSTGMAAIPGDATDPIANELADLSSTFMIIIAAILLEKYMLTLAGLFAFKVLIPIACALVILYLCTNRQALAKVAAKLVLFGICLVLLVPVSTYVTNIVDVTHEASVQQNMDEAKAFADEMNANANKDESTIKKWASKFSGGMKGVLKKAEAILENFIDAAAIMLITSCAIPLLTLWILVWLMRTILGIEVRVPTGKLKSFAKSGSKKRKQLTGQDKADLPDEI